MKLTGVCLLGPPESPDTLVMGLFSGQRSPFRVSDMSDSLVMALFSGSGSPSTRLFSGGLSVMYLFSEPLAASRAHARGATFTPMPTLAQGTSSITRTRARGNGVLLCQIWHHRAASRAHAHTRAVFACARFGVSKSSITRTRANSSGGP